MEPDTLVLDNIDLDLFVKVLSGTLFSPFFTFFVPLVYRAQGGAAWSDPVVVQSLVWFTITLLFWFIRFSSKIYRNGGSLLIGPPRFDWGEQIVLITGGASGVGALLANTLAVRNVTVIVLDINELVTENYNITSYICDVSNWQEVEAIQKRIAEEIGHPTVIVNNAGTVQGKAILDLSEEDVKDTFGTNVFGSFWILKAFLPALITRKTGHIITVSSVLGEIGVSQLTDYCASKAALISLNESLRYELDKKYNSPNIRTTLVIPGHIMTPLYARAALSNSWLLRFIAPTLSTHTVAKAIIAAIDNQFSTTVRLPFYVHTVPIIRLMPSFIRDGFQWFSGADSAMNGFVKMTGKGVLKGEGEAL